jgi:hypothetical protein
MTAWIPEDKKRKTIDMLDTLLAEPPPEFVDLKLAERLHGLLNWVSQLLVTGQYHLPQRSSVPSDGQSPRTPRPE